MQVMAKVRTQNEKLGIGRAWFSVGVTVLVPSSEFITLGAASYAILRYDSDFPSLPDTDEVRKSSALWRILSETLGHTSYRVNVQSFFQKDGLYHCSYSGCATISSIYIEDVDEKRVTFLPILCQDYRGMRCRRGRRF